MNIENFITNRKSIEKLTKEMTQIGCDGWETKYIDNTDKNEWIKVYLESEYHGCENPILFKHPKPSQSELINILIKITNINQISAIACLLKDSEFDKSDNHIEFRYELIEKLENIVNDNDFILSEFERKRLTTIIYDSELDEPYNQREIVKKKSIEVENDHLYYKDISLRAKRILAIANSI